MPPWVDDVVGRRERYGTDGDKVGLAIELARQNLLRETGGPFGAAVFLPGSDLPLSVGVNVVEPLHNSVLHAETVALMTAEAVLGNDDLSGHELFVSSEPCAMCLGAVHWARIERLVFAALREDAERAGFDEGPVFPESYRYLEERGLVTVRGLGREDGAAVLRQFAEREA